MNLFRFIRGVLCVRLMIAAASSVKLKGEFFCDQVAEAFDERPHAEGGKDCSHAHHAAAEKADQHGQHVAGNAAPAELNVQTLGSDEAKAVVRGNAQLRINVKRRGKSKQHQGKNHDKNTEQQAGLGWKNPGVDPAEKIYQKSDGNHVD